MKHKSIDRDPIADLAIDKETGEILINQIQKELIERSPPFWKTPFNHDTTEEANRTAFASTDESKTQRQFAHESDINVILAKFLNTGEASGTTRPMQYVDIEDEKDLQDSIITKHQVEEAWLALPPAIRNTLKDPKTFHDYFTQVPIADLSESDLKDLARYMGLKAQESAPEPRTPEDPPKDPSPGPKAPKGGKSEPPSDK